MREGGGKILLLSDIPPCSNYTGGVVLADQCRQLAPGSLCAFILLNRILSPEGYAELDWIPTETVQKPKEEWYAHEQASGEAERLETHNATVRVPELVEQAAAFGRAQGVTAVWAMLEGQTVTRMALPLAQALGVPLYSQVWDPLSWWLRAHGVDARNSAEALAQFDHTLAHSRAVATASWAMAEYYQSVFGVRSLPVINSLTVAHAPEPVLRTPDRVTIGMVGQFYASDAWASFVEGLNRADWTVSGRSIDIFYLGHEPPAGLPEGRLNHGGWMSQTDAIEALSREADICYCPYPFTAEMEEVSRFSFPSKAVMYTASGRPTLCHAPWYSSPSRYFAKTLAGQVCGDPDPDAVFGMLQWLVKDRELYAKTCGFAHQAFVNDFTCDVMRRNFFSFLELDA